MTNCESLRDGFELQLDKQTALTLNNASRLDHISEDQKTRF